MNDIADNIYKMLETSPLFNLSLCSKELFHSNFLAWIALINKGVFVSLLKSLGCECLWEKEEWTVQREYMNFDLCITVPEQIKKKTIKRVVFILENKVKSIPRKSQLDEYDMKIHHDSHCELLLLSMAKDYPDKQSIKATDWKITNYGELAQCIRNLDKSGISL